MLSKFIFENVPDIINFITPDGIPVIDGLCMILADGGYGTFEAIRRSLLNNPGASMVKKNTSTGRKDIKDNEETLFDEI